MISQEPVRPSIRFPFASAICTYLSNQTCFPRESGGPGFQGAASTSVEISALQPWIPAFAGKTIVGGANSVRHLLALDTRPCREVGRLLQHLPHLQHCLLVERLADELEAERQAFGRQARRHGDA